LALPYKGTTNWKIFANKQLKSITLIKLSST